MEQAHETLRRCDECGRVVHGHAGNACPYCGGARLTVIAPGASALRAAVIQKHPSVLTAAITFCAGLFILHLFFTFFVTDPRLGSAAYNQFLWQFQAIIGGATALYLILRRSEGDFHALVLVSLALFVGSEGLAALVRGYGTLALSPLSSLFNMAQCIFTILALTAAVADGRPREPFGRALTGVMSGWIGFTLIRAYFDLRGKGLDARSNAVAVTILALQIAMLILALVLARSKPRRAAAPAPAADDPRLHPDASTTDRGPQAPA